MKTYLLKLISLHEASLLTSTDTVDRYLLKYEIQAYKRELKNL